MNAQPRLERPQDPAHPLSAIRRLSRINSEAAHDLETTEIGSVLSVQRYQESDFHCWLLDDPRSSPFGRKLHQNRAPKLFAWLHCLKKK